MFRPICSIVLVALTGAAAWAQEEDSVMMERFRAAATPATAPEEWMVDLATFSMIQQLNEQGKAAFVLERAGVTPLGAQRILAGAAAVTAQHEEDPALDPRTEICTRKDFYSKSIEAFAEAIDEVGTRAQEQTKARVADAVGLLSAMDRELFKQRFGLRISVQPITVQNAMDPFRGVDPKDAVDRLCGGAS